MQPLDCVHVGLSHDTSTEAVKGLSTVIQTAGRPRTSFIQVRELFPVVFIEVVGFYVLQIVLTVHPSESEDRVRSTTKGHSCSSSVHQSKVLTLSFVVTAIEGIEELLLPFHSPQASANEELISSLEGSCSPGDWDYRGVIGLSASSQIYDLVISKHLG